MASALRTTTYATLLRLGTQLTNAYTDFQTHLARVAAEEALAAPPTDPIITTTIPLPDGLAAVHNQLQSLNSRKQALRARGSHTHDQSLQDLLAQEFNDSAVIGAETGAWRLRRALCEVEGFIKELADLIGQQEGIAMRLLEALLEMHAAVLRREKTVEFEVAVAGFVRLERMRSVVEGLRVADVLSAADMAEVEAELADLEREVGLDAEAGIAEQDREVLTLLRFASGSGVRIPRQALVTEYFVRM